MTLVDVEETDNQGSAMLHTQPQHQHKLKQMSALHNDVVHRGHTLNSVSFPFK